MSVNLFDDVWDDREPDERVPTERVLGPLLGAAVGAFLWGKLLLPIPGDPEA